MGLGLVVALVLLRKRSTLAAADRGLIAGCDWRRTRQSVVSATTCRDADRARMG
jgi:hypothetical protein